ncbi:unnamed protein product [Clonostachys rosea]|uniref:Zn(2)-C6 fungal-type domain-containing protein n=1 Tax=Bionectria ochroleuca TaxID=29856 RepID=A0ABY6U7G2_BIOOC|nr:unnamed protein product [Clonostachys rosea]
MVSTRRQTGNSGRKATAKSRPTGSKGRSGKDETRSRTFTGCGTCRTRHLKCDEARPVCSSCRRLDLPCQGYAPRLLWVTDHGCDAEQKQSHRGSSFRYPLFTEAAREVMSLELVDSLGKQLAGNVVVDLDDETATDGKFHSVGPFGVFRVFDDPFVLDQVSDSNFSPPLRTSSSPLGSSDSGSVPDVPGYPLDDDIEEINEERWATDPIQSVIDPALMQDASNEFGSTSFAADLNELDNWMQLGIQFGVDQFQSFPFDSGFNMTLAATPPRSPRDPFLGLAVSSSHPSSTVPQGGRKTPPVETSRNETDILPVATSTTVPQGLLDTIPTALNSSLSDGMPNLPSHTAVLLRYLKTKVLEDPSNTNSRMSPWKLMLLPCALETFAEMSLWNTTSNTRLSILCTLLAKSAFHLHRSLGKHSEAGSQWLQVAIGHQRDAQEHLKAALRTEVAGEGQAKYTEMLMAILGVGVVSVYFDGARAVKKLLLDAERLIRLRGFPSNKTFGLRVLHHMYTHLRVIMESTNIFPLQIGNENTDPSELSQVNISGASAGALRRFRISPSDLGDLDLMRAKPEDLGYHDIHLEASGIWPATLYPDMYGIPESLMTLLSQTISLANEKPKLELAAITNPSIAISLSNHIKTLEHQVWSWSPQSSQVPAGPAGPQALVTDDTPPLDTPLVEALILAMHKAIIIYFYRRVYNMSVMIVQDLVKKTLDFIQPYIGMFTNDQDYAISIGWSTFIAACEAATPELQKQAFECLEMMDDRGIFIEADKPSVVAKTVWQRREESGDLTFSWPGLMVQAG